MLWLLTYHYGLAMSPEDALRAFKRLMQIAEDSRIGLYSRAVAHLGIGVQTQALEILQAVAADQSLDEGSSFYGWLRLNPWGDPVLEQSEFVEVRSRLGFRE